MVLLLFKRCLILDSFSAFILSRRYAAHVGKFYTFLCGYVATGDCDLALNDFTAYFSGA